MIKRRMIFFAITLFAIVLFAQGAHAQIVRDSLHSPSLSSNLLDEPSLRKMYVYLPPKYQEEKEKRFPVLYLLHAFNSKPESWLGENGYEGMNVASTLDSLVRNSIINPFIVVMPDVSTKLGGSWLTNSETGGNWTDFTAEDLVQYVDSKYRTLAFREARGIAGQSMGGYGAIYVAMSRPDIFSVVAGVSSPNLVNPDPIGKPAHEFALRMDKENATQGHILARLFWSKAVAFSFNRHSPPLFADLPVQYENGEIVRNEVIWQKWMNYAPNTRVEEMSDSFRKLKIMISVGGDDPLINESRTFSASLSKQNIEHKFIVFNGGHVKGIREHFGETVFKYFHSTFQSK